MFPQDKEILTFAVSGSFIGLFVISFVLVVIIRFKARQQIYLRETEKIKAEFKQTILQAQLEIQEHTLQNISQEIHDNIGQVLSLAKLNLNLMAPQCNHMPMMADTQQLVSSAINDLRNLSKSLNPERIADIDLADSIQHELNILKRTNVYQASLQVTGNSYPQQKEEKIILFRIFQEVLNNIIKHANANTIQVSFDYLPHLFRLSITDNGQGFIITKQADGLGLRNIHNRAGMINATAQIISQPGNGTSVVLSLKRF